MALIDTQTFPLTRQRLVTALRLIPRNPDIFSGSKMREARVQFICGKNVLSSIRGWLLSANIIKKISGGYALTTLGEQIKDNDDQMSNVGSWWCFHLNVCFSGRSEPYRSLFEILGTQSDWIDSDNDLVKKIVALLAESESTIVSTSSIDKNLEGVLKMFKGSGPLVDVGLVDTKKENGVPKIRLSDSVIQEEVVVYALALAINRYFSHAVSVHFSELVGIGLNNFLCVSVNELRTRLREIGRLSKWEGYFSFQEGRDLDSIQVGRQLAPKYCALTLLQDSTDTWM